ncbi:hypothetical protein PBOI14_65170 [Pseudomonas sp. Boi14]|nr:hypothetical protein PBOI14_65170 [Pseudomonas sp. Boi14]
MCHFSVQSRHPISLLTNPDSRLGEIRFQLALSHWINHSTSSDHSLAGVSTR